MIDEGNNIYSITLEYREFLGDYKPSLDPVGGFYRKEVIIECLIDNEPNDDSIIGLARIVIESPTFGKAVELLC